MFCHKGEMLFTEREEAADKQASDLGLELSTRGRSGQCRRVVFWGHIIKDMLS